jgi:quercetin dioxygenase-like cupin family protein
MRQFGLALVMIPLFGAASFAQQPAPQAKSGQAMGMKYESLQWQSIIPELGSDSPQISILRVDPQSHATQLLIRVPKAIHVPMHWHSANETHTVIRGNWTFEHEGNREELGPGGFNYIPAKMHHQAWASNDALVFITVDAGWDVNWVNGPPTKAHLGKTPEIRK